MRQRIDRRSNGRGLRSSGARVWARGLVALLVGLGLSGSGGLGQAEEGTRKIIVEPATVESAVVEPAVVVADPVPVASTGHDWAVLIGIDEYADPAIADLESAVQAVLEARYGFAPARPHHAPAQRGGHAEQH